MFKLRNLRIEERKLTVEELATYGIAQKGHGESTSLIELRRANTMEKSKILIVDDDLDLLRGLNVHLRANHYDTACAMDGHSAIAMAGTERPDLIILDLGLPGGDGFSVMERLRQNGTLSCIPVIVLTARDPESVREKTLEAGAAAFFPKPVDNAKLLSVIRTTLGSA
jgi:DNA-binding response OmpR family regulator